MKKITQAALKRYQHRHAKLARLVSEEKGDRKTIIASRRAKVERGKFSLLVSDHKKVWIDSEALLAKVAKSYGNRVAKRLRLLYTKSTPYATIQVVS